MNNKTEKLLDALINQIEDGAEFEKSKKHLRKEVFNPY